MRYVVTAMLADQVSLERLVRDSLEVLRITVITDHTQKQAVRDLKAAGWRQNDLAALFSVTQPTISEWLKEVKIETEGADDE